MLFYITGGAPQAVPGTACVEANQTVCTEVCCSSVNLLGYQKILGLDLYIIMLTNMLKCQ
jgi:hypothetical protein